MTRFPGQNVFPDTSSINEQGHLVIGGCSVVDLASEYGTPLYLIDEETVRNRCRAFSEELKRRYPDSRVLYGSKAFANIALTRIIVEEGLGIDVVSGGEMEVAKAGGVSPGTVYFHGNNKSRSELAEAMAWGVGRIVVDSFHEIDLLEEVAKEAARTQEILIRVSPSVDPHTHSYISTGTLDSKFGFAIDTGDAEKAVRKAMSSPHLKLIGLHCHIGSQLFEIQPYQKAIRIALEFASAMREEGLNLEEFSPGGGFGIAYTRDQHPPSAGEFAEALTSSLLEACDDLDLGSPRVFIEPGRSIIGPAGVAVYTCGASKVIPGVRTYLSVDGGMGDNIRPALYQASYEAVVANRMLVEPSSRVTIAGRYCESGDVLAANVDLAPTEPGDIIAMPAAGAYAIPMSSNYNMTPRPAVILVKDGSSRLLRRRETYQDIRAADVV